MKLWFELASNYIFDEAPVYIGILAYKHKRKEWKGFTIGFIFFSHMPQINFVTNFKEYKRIMRRSR